MRLEPFPPEALPFAPGLAAPCFFGAAGGPPACFYYVHGYQLVPRDSADVVLTCEYGRPFAAGIERGRIFGVQFHPEKSHAAGLELLRNFVAVPPC